MQRLVFCVLVLVLLPTLSQGQAIPSWRTAILSEAVGYGGSVTGGLGGTLCTVNTLADTGTNSLRDCATKTSPTWVVFGVNGTIALQSSIHVGSNITIDGRAADITLTTGASFPPEATAGGDDSTLLSMGTYTETTFHTTTNVFITHLKFQNFIANTAISVFEGASNVWVNHITTQNLTDDTFSVGCGNVTFGSCGINTGSNRAPFNVTFSWNRFMQKTAGDPGPNSSCTPDPGGPPYVWCSKSMLFSSGGEPGEVAMRITTHHNWFQTDARHPVLRKGWVHAFNNFYDGRIVGPNAVNTNICIDAKFRSENEILERGTSPGFSVSAMIAGTFNECLESPVTSSIVCSGNLLLNGATCTQQLTGSNFTPPYSYTPDTANAALQAAIEANAGWQNVTAPSAATQVVITVQPSTTLAGAVMADWTMEARDASNVLDTAFNGTVSFVIGTNPGGGVLSGTTSGNFSGGVATWCCDVRISQPGVGYTFVVSAPGLTGATSSPFTITAPLVLNNGVPSQSGMLLRR